MMQQNKDRECFHSRSFLFQQGEIMKQRHIKSIQGKFGEFDISYSVFKYIEEKRKEGMSELRIFNYTPYGGIFYIPKYLIPTVHIRFLEDEIFENAIISDNTIIYSSEYGLMKKCKVFEVKFYTQFITYNSSYREANSFGSGIQKGEMRTDDQYILEGNVLIKRH